MIRSFVEQEKLGVRVTRTTTNQMLLDMIEQEMQKSGERTEEPVNEETVAAGESSAAAETASGESAARRRR